MIVKNVFISSTVYDLREERHFVSSLLNEHEGTVRFSCLMSDRPDFPVTPHDLASKHSYEICLDKIALADYLILLVKQRYGAAVVRDAGDRISITHREYREAFRRRLPIFAFVDQRTWDARNSLKRAGSQDFVSGKHTKIFSFIEEIIHQPTKNWVFFFKGPEDIKTAVEQLLFKFDDSAFIGDITVPDGKVVGVNEEFEKIWEIKNNGCQIWESRFLREENAGASGLTPRTDSVPIPRTLPGQTVRISVHFRAPKYPCTCESYWKMVDSSGHYLFPHKKGLFCKVKVVY